MKIAFIYLPGRIARLDDSIRDGCLKRLRSYEKHHPSEFFYGAFELRDQGHDIGIFEVIERPRRSVPKLLAEIIIRKKYLPVKTYVGIIDAVYFLLPELQKYDAVVATTPGIAFSLGIWQALGRFARPIIAIQCGILNYSLNRIRVSLTGKLMNRMSTQLFGIGELDDIKKIYRVAPTQIEVNCFGVDTDFWQPDQAEADEGYILAVGNDALRDFGTLVQAAAGFDTRVIIITKRSIPGQLPENVKIIRSAWNSQELDDFALRNLYRKALAVAVPLKPSLQPSGQSVTLQAMACGKPVILTETRGLWETTTLEHGRNVLLVPPGNPAEWIHTIHKLNEDPEWRQGIGAAGRDYVVHNGLIGQFAARMERLCLKMSKGDMTE